MKSIDLGLMAEHLMAHDGVITKLKHYYCEATNPKLKGIIAIQIAAMDSHVTVMLSLISPKNQSYVPLPKLETLKPYHADCPKTTNLSDKDITLEAHSTAKSMAGENFTSALLMKDPNVKSVHFQMAYQQASLLETYAQHIKEMGWDLVPEASEKERIDTVQKFQKLKEK